MAQKLAVVYFRSERTHAGYDRMLAAFIASAYRNSSLPLEVIAANDLPRGQWSRQKIDMNTHKLEAFVQFASKSDDDLIFLDCDMLVLGDPAEIFVDDFDAAYTAADYDRYPPFNCGLLAFRNTLAGRGRLVALRDMNRRMHNDPEFHAEYRRKYQGINQSALGALLESGQNWHKLPMSVWNLCEPWPKKIEAPKILHCKARLMQDCLIGDLDGRNARWVKLWKKYEKIAKDEGITDELVGQLK